MLLELSNVEVRYHKIAALKGVDMARSIPPLWKEFDALASVPVMVVRGANSDILAAETVVANRLSRGERFT